MNVACDTRLTYTMVPADKVSEILNQIRIDQFRVIVCKPMTERSMDPLFVIVAEKNREEKL